MIMVMVMFVLMKVTAVLGVFTIAPGAVAVRMFLALHLPGDCDGDVAAGNTALLVFSDREDGFSVKRTVQRIQYRFGVLMQLQKGCGQHIAGGTHAAIQIDRFHRFNTSFILPVR